MRAFADAGGVIYAECGGMIYLSHSLQSVDGLPVDMGTSTGYQAVHSTLNVFCQLQHGSVMNVAGTCSMRSGRVQLPDQHDKAHEDGLCGGGDATGLQPVSGRREGARPCVPLLRNSPGLAFPVSTFCMLSSLPRVVGVVTSCQGALALGMLSSTA